MFPTLTTKTENTLTVQYLQLTKLRDHLRNPEMSSDEYRYNCRKMFWRMIMVHGCLGALVLAIACIVSTGYALTCRNMYLVVEKEIRHRLQVNPSQNTYAGQQQQRVHETFANDHSINRYSRRGGQRYNESDEDAATRESEVM